MYIVRIVLTTILVFAVYALDKLQNVPGEKRSFSPSFSAPRQQNAVDLRAKIPAVFIPNTGQTDPRVQFVAQAAGANFYFTPREAVFAFSQDNAGYALRLNFIDANPAPQLTGARPGRTKINYLTGGDPGRWRKAVSTYEEVVYHDLWPGIDLVFRGQSGELEYEFHIAPGADPHNIRLAYRGADHLSLDQQGNLQIHTPLGNLKDSRPKSFQLIDGERVSINSRYVVEGDRYSFDLGSYNPSFPIIIDPLIAYSTYLGAIGNEQGLSIAVDASGSAYITGLTGSSSFPTTAGAFDTTFNGGTCGGCGDAFVAKFDPSGTVLLYATYLGGTGNDQGNGIAVDAEGNVSITGSTESTDFPTTPGAFDPSDNSGVDAFVTKLSADGSGLLYSTYLGGSLPGVTCSPSPCPHDTAVAVAVDQVGNAYVTGFTSSRDFPTTSGAFDTSYFTGSGSTIFVTKLASNGSSLIYSSFLGNSGKGNAIAVAADGSAYVTGNVSSGFPTTPGAFDTTGSGSEAFVTKFNVEGTGLLYSTFLSGSLGEEGNGIAVDAAGNAYVAGFTDSSDYPTTPGAFDTTIPEPHIGQSFVTKLNTDGSALVYSTYLGGSSNDICHGIAIDAAGNAYVTGQTISTDFPTTPGTFDSTFNGGLDVFFTKLNASGSAQLYATYFGGAISDTGRGVAVAASGSVYVMGVSASNNFPTTPGSFDPTLNGGADAFVIKLTNQPPEASPDPATTDEDNSVTINILANDSDPDGDALALGEISQGTNGSATINADNTITYSPAANFYGTDSFTYSIVDTFGAAALGTVTVTINPVNDPPFAQDGSASTNEDETIQINLTATDIDSSELAFSIVSGSTNGTLSSINGSVVMYTPNPNFNGSDSFTFTSNDGMVDSNVANFSITVAPVNDAPDAVNDSASTTEEVSVTVFVVSNDVDIESDALSVTGVSQGDHGAAIINPDGSITYTPALNYFGPDSFTYSVSDGNGGTDTATVNVTIANVQDAPSANDDSATVLEDSGANPINVLVNDSDGDADQLSVISVTQGFHGTAVSNGTSLSYAPVPNYFGPDSFTYTVSDGNGGTDTGNVNVTVSNLNDVPVGSTDSYSIDANSALVIPAPGVLANDADLDTDTLSAILVASTANGTLQLVSDGSFTYEPHVNFRGADSFTYRAFDGTSYSDVVTVQISVLNNLILFTSSRDGNSEIYSMNSDGSNQIRLTNHPATDAFPAWSPSGTQIAFSSNREGTFDIYLMNADGSSSTRLTTNSLVDGGFAWSPDATKIVFSSRRDGNAEIYVINVDGTGLRRLTKSPGMDSEPSWSPDGTRIAFSSDRKRSFEIYVMNADGAGVAQLTKNSFSDVGAAWSPDGAIIAFSSNRDGNFEIYVMNSDGSALVRLTNNTAPDTEPAWLGDKILFTSQRDGNSDIYLMNGDGSSPTRLTVNPAADNSPD